MRRWRENWVRSALATAESDSRSFSQEDGGWAPAGLTVSEEDPLWRQYVTLIDLYKFYLEIAWKVTPAYYVATGVVFAFFFSNVGRPGFGALPLMLIFVSLASFGFSFLTWRAARHVHDMTRLFEYISLSLRFPGRPHVEFIASFLIIDSAIFTAVGLASLALFASLASTVQLT